MFGKREINEFADYAKGVGEDGDPAKAAAIYRVLGTAMVRENGPTDDAVEMAVEMLRWTNEAQKNR
ncbi:hypothetical protein AB0C52_35780 [Streptomyces sp. NPDC048717]|uniref:hypothetical protein n=1 Tax=Streptomyces sp. NPDC048717 TaxID=3154928 RepID=UPI0034238CE4